MMNNDEFSRQSLNNNSPLIYPPRPTTLNQIKNAVSGDPGLKSEVSGSEKDPELEIRNRRSSDAGVFTPIAPAGETSKNR